MNWLLGIAGAYALSKLVDDIEPLMCQRGTVSLTDHAAWDALERMARDAAAYRALNRTDQVAI
jgi:uncharacterized protein YbjQ (UPF0145 family)